MRGPILFILILFLITLSYETDGFLSTSESEYHEYKGYIIELEAPPVIVQNVSSSEEVITTLSNSDPLIERNEVKTAIFDKLHDGFLVASANNNKGDLPIMHEFYNIFNGFSIHITDEQAELINDIPGIKAIHKNKKVTTTLMESVPLIQEGVSAGQLDEDGNDCIETEKECLTGEGVTIAILDTGVDFTHPGLGGGSIDEKRDFDIIDKDLDLGPFGPRAFERSHQISIDADRLAYYSEDTIYIYNFSSQTTLEVVPLDNFDILMLDLKGDSLIYIAENLSTISQISLYYYNLSSGVNIEIENYIDEVTEGSHGGGIGYIGTNKEKVVYTRDDLQIINDTIREIKNIYTYDVTLGTTLKITDSNFSHFVSLPASYGDLIAYSSVQSGGICYQSLNIYNMTSEETIVIEDAPFLGGVLDIKGNQVLYFSCGELVSDAAIFYLYDLNTGEYERISLELEGQTQQTQVKKQNARFLSISDWGLRGRITSSNIVFFNYDYQGLRIAAYDLIEERYVKINPHTVSGGLDAYSKKVCFMTSNNEIYCHDYNSSYNYPPPEVELGSKVVGGYNFVANSPNPMDDEGHGTHVASTAAGNGTLKGVAPGANILAYKVLDYYGDGHWDTVIAGIERAVEDGADILTLSLGGPGNPDDPVSQAVDNAVLAGKTVVVAAGNSGPGEQTIMSPGTARKAITVGATDNSDSLADFSSRGPVEWIDNSGKEQSIHKPDILAPGVHICAAKRHSAWGSSCFDYDDMYTSILGTSMAAPHISGVAALIKQKYPSAPPVQVKDLIKNTAIDLGYGIHEQGTGRINGSASISYCPEGLGTEESPINICDCQDLQNMQEDLTAHYTLFYDIDCSDSSEWNNGEGFEPIGTLESPFVGSLDGNNKTISSLYIEGNQEAAGLFGAIENSKIFNLLLDSLFINGTQFVGGLSGMAELSVIENISISGNVSGRVEEEPGFTGVGGLLGLSSGVNVSNARFIGNIKGTNVTGGVIGYSVASVINNSYFEGNISGDWWVGGITSTVLGGFITNSYAHVNITGVNHTRGLYGVGLDENIENSFALSNRGFHCNEEEYLYNNSTNTTICLLNNHNLHFIDFNHSFSNSMIGIHNSNLSFVNSSLQFNQSHVTFYNSTIKNSDFNITDFSSLIHLDILNSNVSYNFTETQLAFIRKNLLTLSFVSITAAGSSLGDIYSFEKANDFNDSETNFTFDGMPYSVFVNVSKNEGFNKSAFLIFDYNGFLIENKSFLRNGEECTNVTDPSCQIIDTDSGYYGFSVSSWSQYGVNGTFVQSCGNGVLDPEAGEVCDGTDFGGLTCSNFGNFNRGSLSCASDCRSIDSSACYFQSTSGGGGGTTPRQTGGGGSPSIPPTPEPAPVVEEPEIIEEPTPEEPEEVEKNEETEYEEIKTRNIPIIPILLSVGSIIFLSGLIFSFIFFKPRKKTLAEQFDELSR